jgi:hypothetical protein
MGSDLSSARQRFRAIRFAIASLACVIVSLAYLPAAIADGVIDNSAIDFDSDVVPILTKHGCNAGACHGAAAGRGQFQLSLFGSNPDADYEAIVDAFQGRRIHLREPESSLLLAKPSGRIAHEGGEIFDPSSSTAHLLHRWIEQGARRGTKRPLTSFRIEWKRIDSDRHRVQLRAYARLDGSDETDVTDRVRFSIDPSDSLPWDPDHAIMDLDRPGRFLVLARYMQRVVPVILERPWNEPSDSAKRQTDTGWIDAEIDRQLDAMGLSCAPEIEESAWMRRTCLDLTGRLPTLQQLQQYDAIDPSMRRQAWVDQLLNSPEYVEYGTNRMARFLGLRGLSNEPQVVESFAQWIRQSVDEDRPFPEMVRELLTSSGDSHSIGAANFSRLAGDPRNHAEVVARTFMGVRLQCANCHDHPFDRWTQDDYHGLAAVFAGIDRGRVVRLGSRGEVTNLKTMQAARPRIPGVRFLESADLHDLGVDAFAEWLVDPDNPVLARVMVNRIWCEMMGRGLVHPIDDFRETNPASHPQLLERLAAYYRSEGYRVRPLLRRIALSRVYSRSSVEMEPGASEVFYHCGIARPMEPEVLFDAVHDVLEVPSIDPRHGNRFRAVQWIDANVSNESLDILGRCSRPERCNVSARSFGLERQLHWLQGDLVQRPLLSGSTFFDRFIESGADDRTIIENAYRRVYCRFPSPTEIDLWLPQVPTSASQRREWYQDWVWSLLSSSEFMNR